MATAVGTVEEEARVEQASAGRRSIGDLAYRPVREQAQAIASGRVRSRALLEAALERVNRLDPMLNAVVVRRDDAARAEADAADARVASGAPLGPLHGVPMTVKECYSLAGTPTTAGAAEMADHVAGADSVVVERLRTAGAVIYGKTNTPYMADDLQTYNEIYGTTNNPWDPTRTPGGSSGGAAAAVAAGFTSLEMGSDIGGSIRNPAAMCGVFGHKPSWGVVPLRGHVPGPPGQRSVADLAVAGPIGVSADDLEVALSVVAGPDEWDAGGWQLNLPPPRHDRLGAFRVAVLPTHQLAPVSHAVADVLDRAITALAAAGITIVDSLPDVDLERSHRIYQQLLYGVEATGFPRHLRDRYDAEFDQLAVDDASLEAMIIRGVSQRHRHWLAVNERRQRLRAAWQEWFGEVDLLLAPITMTPAFPHDHSSKHGRTLDIDGETRSYWDPLFWAGIATGPLLPATAIPAGLTEGGLPVGIQAVGPYLGDLTCLAFARLSEPVLGGVRRPPGF